MNSGFVGVGRMGANMARRLKDRGYHVTTLYDVNRAAATSLATELAAAASPTLGDVTAGADVVFTIVTDDAAMRDIYTGGDSLLANARGKLFINCATVSPQIHCEAEQWAEAAGASSPEAGLGSIIPGAGGGVPPLSRGRGGGGFCRAGPKRTESSAAGCARGQWGIAGWTCSGRLSERTGP